MLSAFTNCLKIPQLRQRIFFTVAMLFIARVGANIPLPGVDPTPIKDFLASQAAASGGGIFGLVNMFTGGALYNGAIFALGIMPYISASIAMQLMGAIVPSLAQLQQEGEVGRQKIAQYTRYLTLVICLVQGAMLVRALDINPGVLMGSNFNESIVIASGPWFFLTSVLFLTTGTMVLTWIGEQITQSGIGNGISLLITVGILADLPRAMVMTYQMFNTPVGADTVPLGVPHAVLMLVLLFAVIMGVVAITQAQRKIPVQYAKRMVGKKVFGGQSSFMPLKINYSGVMPIIFASAILIFPAQILQLVGGISENLRFFTDFAGMINRGGAFYYISFATLILIFSYFWVSMMFRPVEIADNLKKSGGFIPGVRPGDPTAKFLDFVMTRLTLAGAVFLTLIAVFPDFLSLKLGIPALVSSFFGGTGILIVVGVALDTMRQIETFLLQRHYDGFLKKGRIKGRSAALRNRQLMEASEVREFWVVWQPLLILAIILFLFGLVAFFIRR
jgi:preprotein translocase subunit SecY